MDRKCETEKSLGWFWAEATTRMKLLSTEVDKAVLDSFGEGLDSGPVKFEILIRHLSGDAK